MSMKQTGVAESRKFKCYNVFKAKGYEAAFLYGRRARLKTSTLKGWLSVWKNHPDKRPASRLN